MSNATLDQIEQLARVFAAGNDGDDEQWKSYCLSERNVILTRDTLDDFRNGSRGWVESSPCQEIEGGIFFERVKAMKGQQRVSVAVIDCGEFRLTYQQ
jgi:hypothetical protein